ncbi:radical SAM protein [Candidatus Latescibacterota bacterium]
MNDAVDRFLNTETDQTVMHRDLVSLLSMDADEFSDDVTSLASETTRREFGNTITVSGFLAFSSNCYHDCTYCGLRTSNKALHRYRLSADEIKQVIDHFCESGLERIFLVSGEDKAFSVKDICSVVSYAKENGLHVSLGLGEYPEDTLKAFKDAGTDSYTLKFETSNKESFAKIKPITTFEKRMNCIRSIKPVGLELGSGNIIGLENQTIEDIASDILLMRELDINWAPIVPYLPAPGTPMAEHTPMGNVALTLRVISILRILMPNVLITASQPSQGTKLGFSDPEGNRNALNSGANIIFVDMTPQAVRKDFKVTPGRILPGLAQVDAMLESLGLIRMKSCS